MPNQEDAAPAGMSVTRVSAQVLARMLTALEPSEREVAALMDSTEVTVCFLDSEFNIDCIRWERGRVVIRIEPDGER